MKKKIAVVTTNRADYDQIFWLISKLKKDKKIDLKLIVTGSHLESRFGKSVNHVKKDFKNFKKINLKLIGDKTENILNTISDGINKFSNFFKNFKPNYLLVLGDRYEMLSICLSANFYKIPIIHLNGGELTLGSHDDWVRHCLTKISDIHFVANESYKKRVIQLGENPQKVFNTGGLSSDNVLKTKILDRKIIQKKLRIKFQKKNILLTFHPETHNVDNNLKSVTEIMKVINYFKDVNFFITCSNADEGNIKITNFFKTKSKKLKNCYFFLSLGRTNYISLLNICDIILGNSSSGILEAPYLKKYTINIGNRQQGRNKFKSVLDCPCEFSKINKIIRKTYSLIKKNNRKIFNKTDLKRYYGDGKSSEKMVKIINKLPINLPKKKIFYDLWKNF